MKMIICKTKAEQMKKRYSYIRTSEEYRRDYETYKKLGMKQKKCFNPGNQAEMNIFFEAIKSKRLIEIKWGMKFLIKPTYKIKFEESYKSVRPVSSIAILIYTLGLSDDPNLMKATHEEKAVSDKKLAMDIRIKKFFCFAIITKTKMSYSALGRVMGVDKNTIRNWVGEVREWDRNSQEQVMLEMRTSKNHSSSADVFDLNPKLRQDYSED